MTDPPKVVFLGTHGQHNIGDELLLETFLHQLGTDAHYVVNSYDPELTAAQLGDRYSVEVIDTARDRFPLLRHLLGADRVVFGGGSIVKELYATTGRNRYATLLMILAIVTFTRRVARRPVAMFNIGVGPIATPMGRRLARAILTQVDLVTVRDPGSLATCRTLGLDDVTLTTDAVFSVTPEWLLGGPRPQPRPGPLRIALNLNFDIENPANWDHFTDRLGTVLNGLGGSRPLEIHTLPMQSRFKENDDATMLAALARRLPEITFVHHEPATPSQAAAIIAGCDLVMSERLHAIVMAAILGVPSFVLAYDVKVRELSSMLGLGDYTVDINTPFSHADLEDPLRHLLDDLDGARRRLALSTATLRDRARASSSLAKRWVADGSVAETSADPALTAATLHKNL